MLLLEEYHTLHACVTTWKSGLPIMSTDYQSTLPFGRVQSMRNLKPFGVTSYRQNGFIFLLWCLHFWKRRLNAENNSLLRELADGLCYMTRPALLR